MGAGTVLEHFQDVLQIKDLPASTIVSIVNQKGIVIGRSEDSADWVGRDVSNWRNLAAHFAAREGSDVNSW
ncbi:MAG TPA: hypothetical protein VGI22_02305, partial [Xanthobacteraceae bacterium]